MTALDPSTVIPIRAVPPTVKARGVVAAAAEGMVSLCVNLAVLAGLIHLAFPAARPLQEPNTISVELVPDVPTSKAASAPPPAPDKPSPPAKAQPSTTPPSANPPATPAAVAKPEQDAAPEPSASPPPTRSAEAGAQAIAQSETPPPIGTGADPTPRLVEAPPEASAAAEQSKTNQAANAETEPAAAEKPTERPPAAAPDVVASKSPTADPVPVAASTSETVVKAPAASAEEQREAENTAKLAAALPYSQSFLTQERRAPVSGEGASTAKEYRGAVYGAFHKADDVVAAARTRNLRGQAVVVFTIGDKGELASETIALSSGNPEVDRVALEIVRRSAPYPPPPPGGQRTFSPAIALGLD